MGDGTQASEAPIMTINVSAERNSKGYNYSATVVNATSVQQAVDTLEEAMRELAHRYGGSA